MGNVELSNDHSKRAILLVEDDKTTQTLMSSLLKKRGYDVTVANHGYEALEALNKSEHIQFVISDWVMPKMNGVQLCKELKSNDYSRYMFFVLLSSQDDQDSIINGIDAGADDFVAKNTPIDELDARIRAGFRNLGLHNELLNKNRQLDSAYATIRQDLDSAGDFIRQLLPTRTEFHEASMAYTSIPSAQIGGDILGYFRLDDDHLGFYLLDVSGHGVASALLSFSVHQTLSVVNGPNSLVFKGDGDKKQIRPADEVVTKLNEIYSQDSSNHLYFTMVYAVLNKKTGELNYCSAGHPPIIWMQRKDNSAQFLGDDNFVVGMFDFADYKQDTICLGPEDEIWLYTDGITEARVGDEFYSEERLKDLIESQQQKTFDEKPGHIVSSVREWQENEMFDDDVSILGCKWAPQR
ncbi:SpoIIE family protein phosphatase [Vibrio methylphosphonaticus]|uniref:SpoIIE family protein phosphatase n=1 Tax=Vibrio methylphosphonaticus TaxID=2946866 RepID=UPI00202A4707|nr:SpoIIE family protein phosphatase [Vibrio methylphosphonaticus]MCL9774820.1 SpoIIE family protein phosphatase [Vibrio methylphosphonaticus]